MQANLETTLATLIAIPSVSADIDACTKIIEYVKYELAGIGLYSTSSSPDAERPWIYATSRPTLTPDVLLVAHLDVVPAPEHCFTMRREDGILYGRGIYDMKFAAACYLELFKNHAGSLGDLNIGVLFTCDEEVGGSSMPEVLATGLRPGVVFIPDGGGDWCIESRAKGFYGVRLVARGKSAHGSRPWEGDNALHRIIDMTNVLRKDFPYSDDPSAPSLSVTTISGGVAINQIPEDATATLDFRSFENAPIDTYKARLRELAEVFNVEVLVTQAGSPATFDKEHPMVQPFLRTLEAFRGQPAEYVESYGGTDAHYFSDYGIPHIIIEPVGGGRHSDEEWLRADDLGAFYELLETWVTAKLIQDDYTKSTPEVSNV